MQIKAADDLQPTIVALEQLVDRPGLSTATRTRIATEIRNIRAGEKAERDAAYEIEFSFGRSQNWATIHDLRLEVDGLTAQIDHLILNRYAEIWVCESKSFAEGVSVNEHGGWTRWWQGRPVGMPSPIEQNRRHVALLQRAFDGGLIASPRRLGFAPMKPTIRSLVLVSNGATIGRPGRKVDGIDEVIKADQLKTRLLDEFDRTPTWRMATVIGKEGLEAFARSLAALHRPAAFDWAARFGIEGTPSRSEKPTPVGPRAGNNERFAAECSRCGRGVSELVVRYCEQHAAGLGGGIYCMRCQPVARTMGGRPTVIPDWASVIARYRTPTRLRTVRREAPFIVVASGDDLSVMPDSSGRGRTLTRSDFERAAPLLGRHGRGEVNEASRNSSYVEAILADFGRT